MKDNQPALSVGTPGLFPIEKLKGETGQPDRRLEWTKFDFFSQKNYTRLEGTEKKGMHRSSLNLEIYLHYLACVQTSPLP